ncbi:hypothetical protein FH972_021926 [Carpinus fangiana]|uniref:G-patch domain-containing protein n=1 Tax=Carpinus fangiana TaxID=176857 RepID=A0A5N6KR38_9ROSI|nr:hypothetical protein FH972_021926 [Carpinus fangiana]
MAHKRTRKEFEADLQSQQSPFVVYGTPLPPLDPDVRDDGSYVPVWKQEMTDERGRRRLHGAFTGGFSAGYFNTVGSKEGWTPSTFVSSRTSRQKDVQKSEQERRAQYMDDEDLADAAEAQILETHDVFSGFGTSAQAADQHSHLVDILKTQGETIGLKLLRKMGWKDGQGVGAKVRRKARLDLLGSDSSTHTFAPDDTPVMSFQKKTDRKGVGFRSERLLEVGALDKTTTQDVENDQVPGALGSLIPAKKLHKKPRNSGFGVGVLNDDGSDEEAYEMGPKISYNKVIGDDRRSKKKSAPGKVASQSANPLLGSRPVFRSRKLLESKRVLKRGHDGRLPLDGYVLIETLDDSADGMGPGTKYAIPEIPEGWKPTRVATSSSAGEYLSAADAAKVSKLDPKARAELLGESLLPGKSIFDFMSSASRDRLAAATGRLNLPAGLGEMPVVKDLLRNEDDRALPTLSKEIALAALGRGLSGWMPYADDDKKRARYREYMEYSGGLRQKKPDRPAGVAKDSWIHELQEFVQAAEVFKPMTGMMASRFTSASALPGASGTSSAKDGPLLSTATTKSEDPAEAAAKVGMFGPLTRSSFRFFPTKLVCKRFNVAPPPQTEGDAAADAGLGTEQRQDILGRAQDLVSDSMMEQLRHEASAESRTESQTTEAEPARATSADLRRGHLDPSRNDALEGQRAGEAVFQAIFGDDSDSE